jgi:hypothetical protein
MRPLHLIGVPYPRCGRLVALAAHHGKLGVTGVTGIGVAQRAAIEARAAIGVQDPCVCAGATEAG